MRSIHDRLRRDRIASIASLARNDELKSKPHVRPHRRRLRSHQADLFADPQRLYRLHQDDDEPRRRRHRRQARRQARGRLRLQFQRPLRAGRADPRALRAAADGGRSEVAAERGRRQSRSRQGLGHDDVEREAGRPWRALGRGRHHRHGGVGCGGEDRGQAAVPPARRAPQADRPIRASSSMPPAAITIPARTSRCCAARCAAISTAATTS